MQQMEGEEIRGGDCECMAKRAKHTHTHTHTHRRRERVTERVTEGGGGSTEGGELTNW